MTREERQYFYNQLYKLFHNWVEENKGDDLHLKSISLKSFAERYMQTITGQQPLPQTVFRMFLDECMPILDDVQPKEDVNLKTKEKTIAGAINELKDKVDSQSADGYIYDPNTNSFAAGNASTATGQNAFAEGWGTNASGNQSHAEGNQTIANAPQSHAEGWGTQAANNGAHAEGDETIASGAYSHAEGESTQAIENYAHAEGELTIAGGIGGHAEGYKSKVLAQYAHAEGKETEASGNQSHAEGNKTKASSNQSHAEGYGSQALANGAHAEGDSTIAYAPYSHAEGANSVTGYKGYTEPTYNNLPEPSNTGQEKGGYAHAEGCSTLAVGMASHAEGARTFAKGMYSHAEGMMTDALGRFSHAEGYYNIAPNTAQHVCGYCATIDDSGDVIFQIGIGMSERDRKDALRITKDGVFTYGNRDGETVTFTIDSLKAVLAGKPTVIKHSGDGEINTEYLTEALIAEYTIVGNQDAIIFDSKIRSIWRSAFEGSTVSRVEIPNEIFSIGISAFKNSIITDITLSQNLRTIDGQAFYGCAALEGIVLPSSLKTIGEQAFEGCQSLTSIVIGDSCTSVGRQAFYQCTSLEHITFGAATTLILGGCINGCTSLKTITCKATTPPELYGGNYLGNVEAVYVPAMSVDAYKSASQWSSYANVIQPLFNFPIK